MAQEISMIDQDRVERMILVCSSTEGVALTQSVLDYGAKEEILIEAGELDEATTLNVETELGGASA